MSEQAAADSNFIVNPDKLAKLILHWQEKGYHVLTPAIQMTTFAPGYGVNASLVRLNPAIDDNGRGLDVYFDKATLRPDERGLGKIGLGRIAAAAGVSWTQQSGRRDPGPGLIQNFWIYQAVGVYLAYDGTPQTIHGEKEIDYRDGSAQIGEWTPQAWAQLQEKNRALQEKDRNARVTWNINGWSEARVRQARTNGAERAETGAMERAIRMGFGIKHAYTLKELEQPFVTLRVCPVMDLTDATVRAMVAERQLGGVAALFAGHSGSGPRGLNAAPIDITPIRPREPEVVTLSPRDAQAFAQALADPPAPTEKLRAVAQAAEALKASAEQQGAQVVREAFARAEAPRTEEPPQERRQEERRQALPEGAFYIQDCFRKTLKHRAGHRKAGEPFTLWTVKHPSGTVGTTAFAKWGEIADECYRDGIPVTWVTGEPNGYNECDIQNIAKAGAPSDGADRDEPRLQL